MYEYILEKVHVKISSKKGVLSLTMHFTVH